MAEPDAPPPTGPEQRSDDQPQEGPAMTTVEDGMRDDRRPPTIIAEASTDAAIPVIVDDAILRGLDARIRNEVGLGPSVVAWHADGRRREYKSVSMFIQYEQDGDVSIRQFQLLSSTNRRYVSVTVLHHTYPNIKIITKGPEVEMEVLRKYIARDFKKAEAPTYSHVYTSQFLSIAAWLAMPGISGAIVASSLLWAVPEIGLPLKISFLTLGLILAWPIREMLIEARNELLPATQFTLGVGHRRYEEAKARLKTISVIISAILYVIPALPMICGWLLDGHHGSAWITMLTAKSHTTHARAIDRIALEQSQEQRIRQREEENREWEERNRQWEEANRLRREEELRQDNNRGIDAGFRDKFRKKYPSISAVNRGDIGRPLSRISGDVYLWTSDTSVRDPAASPPYAGFEIFRVEGKVSVFGYVEEQQYECAVTLKCSFSIYSQYCDKAGDLRPIEMEWPLPNHDYRHRLNLHDDCWDSPSVIDFYAD